MHLCLGKIRSAFQFYRIFHRLFLFYPVLKFGSSNAFDRSPHAACSIWVLLASTYPDELTLLCIFCLQKIKYGVIRMHELIRDVLNWHRLYISGRLQKPVRVLCRCGF